jgi:hypothetical protein
MIDASPLPICERCRKEAVCVKVETVYGDRTICYAECFKLFGIMPANLKRLVGQLLAEHDRDFFDAPTRPDIPVLPPTSDEKP